MSLFLFLVGVFMLFYLYTTYDNKDQKNADETETKNEIGNNSDYTAIDGKPKITTLLKNILRDIIQPYSNGFNKNRSWNAIFFHSFADRFENYNDIVNAMRESGLKQCQLVLGIDFTASNEWQGRTTNNGHSLHHFYSKKNHQNPYIHVLTVLDQTLRQFLAPKYNYPTNQDQNIHVYGFGDSITKDQTVFNCSKTETCPNFSEVISSYKESASRVMLGGPTSYAPVIHKAIEIVKHSSEYHILIIIADGQFVDSKPTADAIVAASFYPLSIIVVGVGDGPWHDLQQFDDWLPQREFDNFQFVEYAKILREAHGKNIETLLALHILMEVPDQFNIVKKLGYLKKDTAV